MHASICDIVLDCFQNSVEAKATLIELSWIENKRIIQILLRDNGCGMSKEVLARVIDPWCTDGIKHKHRKVGLGLPFLYQTIEMCNGKISIESIPSVGTVLNFSIDAGHIDCPPSGDLVGTLLSCLIFDGNYEVVFRRVGMSPLGEKRDYEWKRGELQEILGDFGNVETLSLLKAYIQSQEDYIKE